MTAAAASTDLVSHGFHLTNALAKRRAEIKPPLSAEEIDALCFEISLLKAQEELTRKVADKIALTLDVFAKEGLKLARTEDGRWCATMANGHSIVSESAALALQHVTGVKVDGAQFVAFMARHGLAGKR